MTDGLDEWLRDNYRRAAEHIHPDPDLIRRATESGRARRRSIRWPLSAAIAATAATAAALVLAPTVGTSRPGPSPAATPPALAIALQADRTEVSAGARVRLSGITSGTGLLTIFIDVAGRWRAAGQVRPTNGRYTAVVTITQGVTAVRLCSGPTCSAPLQITVLAATAPPSPIASLSPAARPSGRSSPAATPHATPAPPGYSPLAATPTLTRPHP